MGGGHSLSLWHSVVSPEPGLEEKGTRGDCYLQGLPQEFLKWGSFLKMQVPQPHLTPTNRSKHGVGLRGEGGVPHRSPCSVLSGGHTEEDWSLPGREVVVEFGLKHD